MQQYTEFLDWDIKAVKRKYSETIAWVTILSGSCVDKSARLMKLPNLDTEYCVKIKGILYHPITAITANSRAESNTVLLTPFLPESGYYRVGNIQYLLIRKLALSFLQGLSIYNYYISKESPGTGKFHQVSYTDTIFTIDGFTELTKGSPHRKIAFLEGDILFLDKKIGHYKDKTIFTSASNRKLLATILDNSWTIKS